MTELTKIHNEAIIDFNNIQAVMRDERKQCLEDRRFYSIPGAMWEGPLGQQFENKPKLEVNKAHLSLIRIFSEYRNNRITVDFIPRDGSDKDKLADLCDGLYRADEQDSVANESYDNAFEEGVGGGIGGWRLRAEYEDEYDPDNDFQRIRFEPIFDADSTIFFDLGARRYDKSDAKRCYVLNAMPIEAYKELYEDDPVSWPQAITADGFRWVQADIVYTAELYKVEEESEEVQTWLHIDGKEESLTEKDFEEEGLEEELHAIGSQLLRARKIKRRRIHKYLMSGGGILEDCGFIAGPNIPIVPFYGKRWIVDSIERAMGHVRLVKDSQRLKNMQISKLAEISAFSSVSKPILSPEQVAGHESMWSDDNIKNFPYLLINPIESLDGQIVPAGPLGYTKVPEIPPAMAALLQLTDQDIQDLLGNQQAGEELQANVSGKAIELIQNRLDMQVFIYMDNMSKSMKRSGEIWLGMGRELYVEEGRKMKTVSSDGETDSVEFGVKILDSETGEIEIDNDLAKAKYDILASVGPSSDSKRAATVRALTGMASITEDPETKQVLGAMAMMNMEGEGISDVRAFFRKKLIRMGALKPTDKELEELQQEMENTPPDPNSEFLNAAAEEASAKAKKSNADTITELAVADKTKAQTAQILSEIDRSDLEQALQVMERLIQPQIEVPTVATEPLISENGEV